VTDKKLIVCLLAALLLRLAFVFIGFPHLEQRWHLREDGDGYGLIAQSIREGHYDNVTRGPVYPGIIAAVGSPIAVKILQAILDTVTCWLVYLMTRRSWWPAALWAVYPFAIWRVAFINKEIVLTFLLVNYVWTQLDALQEDKLWQWAVAGLMLGLVNLCKPMFLLWPLLVLPVIARGKAFWARASVLILAVCAFVLPWTYRNWRVTGGEFLAVATEQGGLTTFVGNYQPTLGLWEGPDKVRWMAAVDAIKLQNTGASPVQLDRAYYREAWRQVTHNPLKAAGLFVRKCGRFWFLSAARREQAASILIQAAYLLLASFGLWRLRPWSREVWLMLGLIGYVMLLHAFSYADLRFSLPVMPLVCVLAGVALQRKPRKTVTTLSAAR
jgi:hypothetical protein